MCPFISLLVLLTKAVWTAALYNAAQYKPAFQSSEYLESPHGAFEAVNGNTDWNSLSHTDQEFIPWWMVDLRGQFTVEIIQITNLIWMTQAQRLRKFEIDIFEEDPRKLTNFPYMTGHLCYSQISPLDSGTYNFTCPAPVVGRFVRLVMKLDVLEYLHICEMELLVSGSSFEEIYFSKSQNYKMSGSALATLTVTDQNACTQECLFRRSTSYCTAFNWVQSSKSCELFSVNPFIDLSSNLQSTQIGCEHVKQKW